MSEIIDNLPDVVFAEKSADEIVESIITSYQSAAGVTLYPGDPVRLFLETIAYVIAYQRNLIDYTGKMNLLAYASGDYLDHLGAFVPVARLPSVASTVVVRFTLSEAQAGAVLIPQGTRVAAGEAYFETADAAQVAAGGISADVPCVAVESGSGLNGLVPGQIDTLVDPIAYVQSVVNITTSEGGSDVESDDNYRERIQLVLESLSVAGPMNAYKLWALSASSDIADVSVAGPAEDSAIDPGNVYIYPLLAGGVLPGAEILAKVDEAVNAEDIRPLTDYVHVEPPAAVNFTLNVTYWIDRSQATAAASIQQAVSAAASEWVAWQKEKLGRDINPSELIHRLVAAGAKRAVVASPAYAQLSYKQVGICTSATVTFGGLENG